MLNHTIRDKGLTHTRLVFDKKNKQNLMPKEEIEEDFSRLETSFF